MDHLDLLQSVELFEGVTLDELKLLASICRVQNYPSGEVITAQGETGDEIFIVQRGFVEVIRSGITPEAGPRTVVNLGEGQIFGEMALVDHGPRSATIKAASDPTSVLVIMREDFERSCDQNYHLGYVVMRNIAADLSFKLRHRNLTGR
jgi:CRP-like cAMP-binding protein